VALEEALKRRPGLVGFVGAVRAVRDPAAGVAAAVALVVGISVAVFSTVVWATTKAGGDSSSIMDVGADLRADGPRVGAEEVEAVTQLTGVSAAAAVTRQNRSTVVVGNQRVVVDMFVVDAAGLAAVQAGLPGVSGVSDGVARAAADGVVPAMASTGLAEPGAIVTLAGPPEVDTRVVDTAPAIAGLPTSRPWILIDRSVAEDAGIRNLRFPRTLLIATADGVDPAQVTALLDGDVQLSTAADVLAEVRAGAVGAGLMSSFVVAVAVVGALVALTVVMALLTGAPSRGRLLSQLRTLGLSGRQARGLVVWEIAPIAVTAVMVGGGLGLGIPRLVLGALDLRPLTGAAEQPSMVVDWGLVAMSIAVFVVVVGLAVGFAVTTSRRLRLGTVLRVGGDG
jgi:putative ABC transport system permease protein